MRRNTRTRKIPLQSPLVRDKEPPLDLSSVRNDADDQSDADRPTTDHEAEGWRDLPPAKP